MFLAFLMIYQHLKHRLFFSFFFHSNDYDDDDDLRSPAFFRRPQISKTFVFFFLKR